MTISATHYSFDTSALIDGIERFYPIDNFPALWNRIDDLIKTGRLHVSEEAWNEAVSVDSAVKEWCKDSLAGRERCVVPTDAAIAITAGSIVQQFPRWTQQGSKSHADPFVVAVAEIRSCAVISGETNGGPGRPKIPYVCSQRQVQHGKFVDVVVREGWVFG